MHLTKIIDNNIPFKKQYTFEERHTESSRVMGRYSDRVPIICEKLNNKMPTIDKKKYLVPIDLTMGQFMFVIRKRLHLKAEEALFLTVNNKNISATSAVIGDVYNNYKDNDGFLYINYTKENTFG